MSREKRRVAIIGSGPAGWTAAIYLARAGRDAVVVQGLQPGGQLMITTDVENYPGFVDPIMGPELMAAMEGQACRAGATVVSDIVTSLDRGESGYTLQLEGGGALSADAVILATGAKARWLGAEGEQEFMGKGVSACATCDGFFFRKKPVVVIGGGNTAFEEALYLSNLASHVTLIHRSETFRAERILVERLRAKENVSFALGRTVVRFDGNGDGLTGVETTLGRTDALGAFVAIGHDPVTSLVRGIAKLDESGYVVVEPGTTNTGVPGLFAAGDVCDPHYRQAVTSAGMGCMAALDADRYVDGI